MIKQVIGSELNLWFSQARPRFIQNYLVNSMKLQNAIIYQGSGAQQQVLGLFIPISQRTIENKSINIFFQNIQEHLSWYLIFGKNHQQICLVSLNEILRIIKFFLDIPFGFINTICRLFYYILLHVLRFFFENRVRVWYMFLLGHFSSSKT